MSLRPDDRAGRSRSKSPARTRDRSRSVGGRDLPPPSTAAPSAAYNTTTVTPQYEVRQPSQAYAAAPAPPPPPPQYATPSSIFSGGAPPPHPPRPPSGSDYRVPPPPIGGPVDMDDNMGGYKDFPPHMRPGYIQQQQQQQQQAAAGGTGAHAAFPNVQYAQPLQYPQGTQQQQWNYTATPANAAPPMPPRTTSGAPQGPSYQYAPAPDKITYTSKPVTASSKEPPPHTYQHPQYTHAQPPPPAPQQQQQTPYYTTAQPHPPYQPPVAQPVPEQYTTHHAEPMQPSTSSSGHHRQPSEPSYYDSHRIVEIAPSSSKLHPSASPRVRPHRLSVHGQRPDLGVPPSPGGGLGSRMERLSVSGNRPDIQTIVPGGLPPPSPMLEAYHGTYQSISPMPSPMMLPLDDIDDIPLDPRRSSSSVLSSSHRRRRSHSRNPSIGRDPRDSRDSRDLRIGYHRRTPSNSSRVSDYSPPRRPSDGRRPGEPRHRMYDATDDALALVDALSQRSPNVDTLIDIIPALSHNQLMDLRAEYKRHCKVQGRGINVAKHIKMKCGTSNFGKICYVTALGRWESEAHWANFWYQSASARSELLIEALMGRTNTEIREIKAAFKDKRYGDSLVKCMDKELKADKFRKAVLMALDGERQDERDVLPVEYRNRDVDTLYRALKAREGGESAMLQIVVTRSDAHLREVLRTFERKYEENFARAALRRSNNLVGEVIAHILNGVINKPARDALTLHHALTDLIELEPSKSSKSSKSSSAAASSSKQERQQRYELLISRLVRLHWDRLYMASVKRAYEDRYGREVEEDLVLATKGDFREFCLALCETGRA